MSRGKRINCVLQPDTANALEALLESSGKSITEVAEDAIELGHEYVMNSDKCELSVFKGPAPQLNITHLNHLILEYSAPLEQKESGRLRINFDATPRIYRILKETKGKVARKQQIIINTCISALHLLVMDAQAGYHFQYVFRSMEKYADKHYVFTSLQEVQKKDGPART